MVSMFTRLFASHCEHGDRSLSRINELGNFEIFKNKRMFVSVFSVVYRANFLATFRYDANFFSLKFVILNDILRMVL